VKIVSMLPPVVALVVVATWLGLQRRSIAMLDDDCVMLRNRLAADSGAERSPAKSPVANKPAPAITPINWKTLAGQFDEMQRSGATADMRVMLRFQQRLQALTQEEILTALDDLAALGLSANAHSMLEQMLIGPLIEKDPELALTRFMGCLQEEQSGIKWHLSNALRQWAKLDSGKANAWLDQQIAAGKFDSKTLDGRSQFRMQFEGVMLDVLLPSDPAAAGSRLGALPEDQRAEVLSGLLGSLKEENLTSFAKLVRDQLPAKAQALIFAQQAGQAAQGGYRR
jgi:hypothetical protein